ncbi:EF-hand domain-containing protein [Marilutibacter spongiae]|uniref:EF-hand domain-containing protein n=1 Tax=Marilutibacter spongiae TaxID=2025720 RepID=A0A7W3TNI2_9GAMM|nr:EF-hand domain-containing protein [Lysobacter spongiae]MBB1061204.1 EF-hand domain-containing protein [Lysobacter spongiae]
MNKSNRKPLIVALALTAAMSSSMAFAQEQDATATEGAQQAETATMNDAEAPRKSWADIDVNQDGSVSKDEAASVPALSQVFDEADADADGNLTADEYKAYVAKAQGGEASSGQ